MCGVELGSDSTSYRIIEEGKPVAARVIRHIHAEDIPANALYRGVKERRYRGMESSLTVGKVLLHFSQWNSPFIVSVTFLLHPTIKAFSTR